MAREVRAYTKVCSEPTFIDTKIKYDLDVASKKKLGSSTPEPSEPKFLVRMRGEKELYSTAPVAGSDLQRTRPLASTVATVAVRRGSTGAGPAPPILNPSPLPRPSSPASPTFVRRATTNKSQSLSIAGLKREDTSSVAQASPADSVQSSPNESTA